MITCLAIVIFSVMGIYKIIVDTAMINYLPPDSDYRQDTDYIDERFAGTNQVFLLVEGQENGDMTKPEILKAVDNMEKHLVKHHPEIGKTISFTTFLKRMNQVMHIPELAESAGDSFDDFASFDDGGAIPGFDDEIPGFDDSGEIPSFDDSPIPSFGDDAFAAADTTEYVDQNVAYKEKLLSSMTYADGLKMLNEAYAAAGGSHATVEQVVEELAKKLNFNGMAYYEIPSDPEKYQVPSTENLANLVSQYLILLGNDDMKKFLQSDMISPKDMRITVMLRSHNTVGTKAVIADAEAYAAKHFPEGYKLIATGNAQMEAAMSDMVINSQLVSLLISLLSVFVILAFSFKSAWGGLLGCIPLAFTILLNYMVMGFMGIKLDLFTSIIASVAVGVGIDYTIHFMETYRAERQKSDDLREVTIETFHKTGAGIVTNAIAVGFGFLVLCLSYFVILRDIGLLVAVVMFTSSTMAMTIIPGILNLTDPKFMRGSRPRSMPSGSAVAATIDVDSNKQKIDELSSKKSQ